MHQTLGQKVWSEVIRAFPERQIYIRSDGRVQFFAFDPMMQAICAGAALVVLGWVAFASVNVIFKDRIIEAKERHFVAMQQAYESRIADLQISYDELNGALAAAEDRFEAAADSLETKEKALADVIERKQALQVSLGIAVEGPARGPAAGSPSSLAPVPRSSKPQYLGMNMGMGGILEQIVPSLTRSLMVSPLNGTGPLRALSPSSAVPPMLPEEAAISSLSAPRPTFLEGAVRRIGEFFGRKPAVAEVDHPLLRHITQVEARVATLDEANPRLAVEAKADIDKEAARLKKIARTAGIDPAALSTRVKGGQGGPLVRIGLSSQAPASADPSSGSIAAAQASLANLDTLVAGFKTLPLSMPFDDASITSGFGGRADPFTENFGYHTGLDLSGPLGTDVRVTAPGLVVYAARAGDYGNMVEIDHGNGIHTRYAHLMKIKVPLGAQLEKDDVVGELGSTGRSTGPHVHYEVWYDNVVKDPQRFIKAGRDVLKTQ